MKIEKVPSKQTIQWKVSTKQKRSLWVQWKMKPFLFSFDLFPPTSQLGEYHDFHQKKKKKRWISRQKERPGHLSKTAIIFFFCIGFAKGQAPYDIISYFIVLILWQTLVSSALKDNLGNLGISHFSQKRFWQRESSQIFISFQASYVSFILHLSSLLRALLSSKTKKLDINPFWFLLKIVLV